MLSIRGKVNKNIALPPGIDPDKIKASYRSGVLELRLPKEKRVKVKFE
jgi:HSP20 family molecular chaperone IbpA